MQLISVGNFYFGIEEEKYCDCSIHLGNFILEYQCPSAKQNDDQLRPKQGGDGLSNGKNGTSN